MGPAAEEAPRLPEVISPQHEDKDSDWATIATTSDAVWMLTAGEHMTDTERIGPH